MATEYQFEDHSQSSQSDRLFPGMNEHTDVSTGAMDMLKRDKQNCHRGDETVVSANSKNSKGVAQSDRFELLSAYLDGEVTAVQRKQVEEWLANDAATKKLYHRLFSLRRGLRTLPVPQQQPVENTVEQVLKRVNRPYKRAFMIGGTAIAACLIGAFGGLFSGESGIIQFAQQKSTQTTSEVASSSSDTSLQVALNQPVFPIPKAAENSQTEESSQNLDPQDWDIDSEFN
ncbi:MAG: transcriptional regulator [Cyanobacteria bacterium P01_A01_bin.84]